MSSFDKLVTSDLFLVKCIVKKTFYASKGTPAARLAVMLRAPLDSLAIESRI